MKIWLVTSGEPIPSDKERPHRTGILSEILSKSGNDVVWWTTNFDHQKKIFLYETTTEEFVNKNLKRIYLSSKTPYKKNVSLKRIINHYEIGKSFKNESKINLPPDLIYCSFPTIDLAYEAVKYGIKNNIPVVIDIRDLWPDIFLLPFIKPLRYIIRLCLIPLFIKTKYIFKNCFSITAVSENYLKFGIKYGKRNQSNNDKVFPLGYDVQVFNNIDINTVDNGLLRINPNNINIWFIGTFGQTYDLTTVIEVARILEKQYPHINFIFTGDGEKMPKWKKAASGLSNVIFTGWIGKAEIKYISMNVHIGLMAYAKNAPQGLPNKIFEYMSFGLVILSSLHGETRELIEKYDIGLVYEPQNTEDLLKKILNITRDKQKLLTLKHKIVRVFNENFNSSKIYIDLANYLQQIPNAYDTNK